MSNQTLIAVPADVTNEAELRQFLVRLVIELDKVIGYRGSDTDSLESLAERVKVLEEQ